MIKKNYNEIYRKTIVKNTIRHLVWGMLASYTVMARGSVSGDIMTIIFVLAFAVDYAAGEFAHMSMISGKMAIRLDYLFTLIMDVTLLLAIDNYDIGVVGIIFFIGLFPLKIIGSKADEYTRIYEDKNYASKMGIKYLARVRRLKLRYGNIAGIFAAIIMAIAVNILGFNIESMVVWIMMIIILSDLEIFLYVNRRL